MVIFWKWWTSVIIVLCAIGYAEYYDNLVSYVYMNDSSYITWAISALVLYSIILIGTKAWKLQFTWDKLDNDETYSLWFYSDVSMSLGMVGTLVGFIMVLTTAFAGLDPSDINAMKAAIGEITSGMGVAILTTLVGLIGSIIIKFQLIMLEQANAKEI